MYADIENLNNKITLYYSQNGQLPIKKEQKVNIPQDAEKNPNDNENYFVIDLASLQNLSLNFGRDFSNYKTGKKDVYIINEQSHTVYYLKGIQFKGKMYYTASSDYNEINYTGKTDGTYDDVKKVNTPVIDEANGMELVVYDNGNWVKDISKYKYNYIAGTGTTDNTQSQWANAKVTINGVESYFVWIPRYAYKIDSTNRTIDVKFIKGIGIEAEDGTICKYADDSTLDTSKDYIIHPAFTTNADLGGGWNKELPGLWIGKYETSLLNKTNGEAITTNTNIVLTDSNTDKALAVQPNKSSWRNITIGNMFTNAYNYSRNLESHMLKNSEWGAVAYLTHSSYGRNGNSISPNKNSSYITGEGGVQASSTGNNYGIFDLNGGSWEKVSAYYNNNITDDSGSSFTIKNGSSNRYTTVYSGVSDSDYIKGDATYETKKWQDSAEGFFTTSKIFLARGGGYNDRQGLYTYGSAYGKTNSADTFRMCLVPQSYYDKHDLEYADGTWSEAKNVNTPNLKTGLTPVTFDDKGKAVEISSSSDKWYNYEKNEWANAVTKDKNGNITGYFVWIPRYEYKITYYTDSNKKTESKSVTQYGKIDVNFIKTTQTKPSEGYKIHPAFQDGTSNNFKNGEWDKEISGFWVAKYPAGYQKNTITDNGNGSLAIAISNDKENVVYSNEKKYTSYVDNLKTNPLNQKLTASEYSNEKISYPVFKPLTYAYNNISIGDMYTISQEIKKATNFYGLANDTDSHMMKNSEWGAVAYLTYSKYGRNGTEPNINNYYTSASSPYRVSITGIYANGMNNSETTSIGSMKPYYEINTGVKGSSTGNITGVYDLNGCIWEYVAGYITNGNSTLTSYGQSFAKTKIDTDSDKGYETLSTKYATVYPYNISNDTNLNNYNEYKTKADAIKNKYGYGDAILETSINGNSSSGSWNGDYSDFICYNKSFFYRGGRAVDRSTAGVLAFASGSGRADYNQGFRVALVFS